MENLKVIDFEEDLLEAYLIKREKRFFIDFLWEQNNNKTDKSQKLVAHTNNTGSMLGLLGKGRRILLSKASNPNRKLAWTLEAVSADYNSQNQSFAQRIEHNINHNSKVKIELQKEKHTKKDTIKTQEKENWIGVNTSIPNKFLHNLFQLQCAFPEKNILPWAKDYKHIRMEATNGESRLDALLYSEEESVSHGICNQILDTTQCAQSPKKIEKTQNKKRHAIDFEKARTLWIECKSVTLVEEEVAAFPDAISERGAKHLETLMRILQENILCAEKVQKQNTENNRKNNNNTSKKTRAAMLYIIQRTDGTCFSPADYIDKKYSKKLLEAYKAGVEVYAIIANVQKDGIYYGGTLPLAPCFFT